jgi:Tol biopolymer transport system component
MKTFFGWLILVLTLTAAVSGWAADKNSVVNGPTPLPKNSAIDTATPLPKNPVVDASPQPVNQVTALCPNLAGTEIRLLPSGYDVWSCDWSPDGKSLVFAGKLQGDDAPKMRIWLWPLDPAGDPVPLTNSEELIDFSPRWSPDGAKIVLTRRNFRKTNSNINSAIWLKEIASGAGKQITAGPEDRDPSWSPDGTQVVISRGQGPYNAQLVVVNLTDGTAKVLAGQDGELLNSPCWGKDGKIYFGKLCPSPKTVTVSGQSYQVMDFGKGTIWAFNPANNTMGAVVADEFDNRLPALSPDGTRLAFVSSRSQAKEGNGKFDRGSLYIKNLNSGELYVTNKVGLNGGSLSWSPDGKKIAFFTFRSIRPAVWVINIP